MATQAYQVWTPPPDLTVSEWADRYRILSDLSNEPGRWHTSRAEYLRGIMDAASDPGVEELVLLMASQTGKTSVIENVVGYFIDVDPCPILWVVPTLDLAQGISKGRLSPMIRDNPRLGVKVAPPRSRDRSNTLLQKVFAGGFLKLAGANSPASLSSWPIRLVLGDEVDRFPVSAGNEGDPVALAAKRTQNFWNRLKIWASTPTVKGASRIQTAYDESDQREFWVPCPHCVEPQRLAWRQVKWPGDLPDELKPAAARYHCEHCGAEWSEGQRHKAVQLGEWRAGRPFAGKAGFRLSALYSPWLSLAEGVRDFLAAKDDPTRLRTWTNTYLAEPFEEFYGAVEAEGLEAQRNAEWSELDPVPAGVLLITAGVDVQDDRFELEVVGWGLGEESWSLRYQVIDADPSTDEAWRELDDALAQTFVTELGHELPIELTGIDTGHHTLRAYRYCKPRYKRGVRALKGKASSAGEMSPPVWPARWSTNNKGKVKLYLVGVDSAKSDIYGRYAKVKAPGPGYSHFPRERDSEYFRQATAERYETKYRAGHAWKKWSKDSHVRNEATDCRVYAYCVMQSRRVKWAARAARLSEPAPGFTAPKKRPAPAPALPAPAMVQGERRSPPPPAAGPPPVAAKPARVRRVRRRGGKRPRFLDRGGY